MNIADKKVVSGLGGYGEGVLDGSRTVDYFPHENLRSHIGSFVHRHVVGNRLFVVKEDRYLSTGGSRELRLIKRDIVRAYLQSHLLGAEACSDQKEGHQCD